MVNVTAVELNYIIIRYLLESGFKHTAFNFGFEAGVSRSVIEDKYLVQPAALVKLVQKGLEYFEKEANLTDAKNDDEDFIFLTPMDIITKDVYQLQKIVMDKKKKKHADRKKELEKEIRRPNLPVTLKGRKDLEKQDMGKVGKKRGRPPKRI